MFKPTAHPNRLLEMLRKIRCFLLFALVLMLASCTNNANPPSNASDKAVEASNETNPKGVLFPFASEFLPSKLTYTSGDRMREEKFHYEYDYQNRLSGVIADLGDFKEKLQFEYGDQEIDVFQFLNNDQNPTSHTHYEYTDRGRLATSIRSDFEARDTTMQSYFYSPDGTPRYVARRRGSHTGTTQYVRTETKVLENSMGLASDSRSFDLGFWYNFLPDQPVRQPLVVASPIWGARPLQESFKWGLAPLIHPNFPVFSKNDDDEKTAYQWQFDAKGRVVQHTTIFRDGESDALEVVIDFVY